MEPHGIRRIQFNCYKVKEADWVGGDNGVGNPSAKAMAELGNHPTLRPPIRPRNVRLEADELFVHPRPFARLVDGTMPAICPLDGHCGVH